MERLQDIAATRRRKMAHTRRLRQIFAHSVMYWVPEDDRRTIGRPKKIWRSTFRENLEQMGVSWHGLMEPARSPVTETDGDFSSPDAPRRTGGTKSK